MSFTTTCCKLCKISFDFNDEPLTKLSSVVGLKSERKDLNAFDSVNYGDRKQETHLSTQGKAHKS